MQYENDPWEEGRLKTLTERKGQPFHLSQLKMDPTSEHFAPAPSEEQIAKLEKHFSHPLPTSLKEIFNYYNGGCPKLHYYGEDEYSSLNYFYTLDDNRNDVANIWCTINSFSKFLGPETLPFAEDDYQGIFFLKWVEGKAQVWIFQYGDQPFVNDDDDDDDDDDKMPTYIGWIFDSFDEFLEALYEAED